MKSAWRDEEALVFNDDLLALRVYTSKLLGIESDLVLHGGGNTSVKVSEFNIFGEEEDLIYVKGSGWDLATIKAEGFAPVKMDILIKLVELDELSDMDMVKNQRLAMTDPMAPNPSVEAILHAIIPFVFVDHTHADAVVTITNTADGEERIKEIYGDKILIIPYVMPGFILAKEIYERTKDLNWNDYEGMILLNHGVFTFHDDPKICYEKMIEIVTKAENYLEEQGALVIKGSVGLHPDLLKIAKIRNQISALWKQPVLCQLDSSESSVSFGKLPDVAIISGKGPLTPDHIIRTKRIPLVITNNFEEDLEQYANDYDTYFNTHCDDQQQLDKSPRWAIWPKYGNLIFENSIKNIGIIKDISQHTMKAIYQAEVLDQWQALPQKDLFEMEYWSLEQAKLTKNSNAKTLQGKIALVTGAANGIGKACVNQLIQEGACVAALDIHPSIKTCFKQPEVLGIECDITNTAQIKSAIEQIVLHFGGIDLLVSNAGIFPKSYTLKEMDENIWEKSLDINLSSHQRLMKICIPFLELGLNPAIVLVGSKNVPAPGPGAAAYSVAKAGLTQLGRIGAMELGPKGIRVNIVHPNAVYDTGIWTDEILASRAEHYGLSIKEYKTNNILKQEITSKDVASLIITLLGPIFSKITGAQIPIDGGNDRII